MALGSRLLSLVTLSSLAIFICSFHATPVAALSVHSVTARGLHHRGHEALAKAKRKRSTDKKKKRCKPKPAAPASPSAAASSTPAPSSSTPAPSSSTSSHKADPTSSASSSNSGGNIDVGGNSKAGLGWPNGENDLSKWKGLVSTIYTWAPACPSNAKSLGMTCCPMLWGWDQVGQFKSEVDSNAPECAMGPNEPEIAGQSNMNAGSGVALWNQYIRPLKQKGTTLISPAPTSDPAGKKWLQDFFSICGGDCDVDIIACHWYDISGDALVAYLEDLHNTFNKPMWLTEFACQNFNGGAQCSKDQVWDVMTKLKALAAQSSFLLKYMPFGAMHDMQGVNTLNQLMAGDGGPNALANAYFS